MVRRSLRNPAITSLGFTMYRLELYQSHAPGESPYAPVEVLASRGAMSVLMRIA